MGSLAGVHRSMALISSALVMLMVITLLSTQDVEAQTCNCTEISTTMDFSGSDMDVSDDSLNITDTLNITVENVTVTVNDQCNSFMEINWILRGDGVMLTEVNFTITITDSMGNVNRTVDICASDCDIEMTCGEHLAQFTYTAIDGLKQYELYNVSIKTTFNETNTMHVVRTPVVSITANTTTAVPGELNISSTLLGPETRTLAEPVEQADGGLSLITQSFDIAVFSNDTAYNLSFTQVNSMEDIEDYSITAELRNAQPQYNNSQTVAVGSSLNITDIIPFANYTLCVRAVNCGGLGPQKCITLIAPEAAPTTPPTNLTATPGMTNVTLMWIAPDQPNGIVTYDYEIINSTNGIVMSEMTTELNVTVTGLDHFTNYTFNVTARTSAGSNGPATGSFSTLQGISEAVEDLSVSPNKRSASLTASPPPVTNGIIISYDVSYNVNGSTNITTLNITAEANQHLSGTIESLLPFTYYVFSVRACTEVGCGPSSENELVMTLEDAPSMPVDLMFTINNSTSVTLTWQQPAMLNGIIRNYTITVLDSNMNSVQNITASNLTSVITQLTPNTSYVVNVSGVTVRAGDAASITFTTPPLPTIPLNVTVTTGNMLKTLIVQWEPPSSPGGTISMYMVTYNNVTVDTSDNDTNYNITGLQPYTNYSITVIACTRNGCGNQSDVAFGTTEEEAPNPPLNVNATTINSTAVQVSWNPPNITNGIIRYYTVVYGRNDSSETQQLNSIDITTVVTALDPFRTYVFYVLAFTVELSNRSESDSALTSEAAPSAPLNVAARNVSSTSILVTWMPPMARNGIIRLYRVEYTRLNGTSVTNESNTTNTSVVIEMLDKYTTYTVQVFATTVAEGDGSENVTVTTDEDRPGIPGNLFVNEINSTAITVTWDEPVVTNGIITMYEILHSSGNHTVLDDNATVVEVNATMNTSYEFIIDELDPFTVYTFAVRAYTRIGAGNLTDTSSVYTDPSASSPPLNFTVEVLNSMEVQLTWQYPEFPNGEIRGYSILSAEPPANEEVIRNITLDHVDDSSDQTVVVDGLVPFTYYSFRVRAFSFGDQEERPNFIHIGDATDEIIVRTDEDVPEAPTNFTAMADTSTTIQLSWNSPNVNNGILLYYTVEYYNTTDTLMMIYDNDTFADNITGLNEDTLYTFVIYANTSAGDGPNATDSDVTFEDRPSAAPQNVATVVINSTSISVSWYPPPFLDQNGEIIGYQLMITNQNRTNSQPMIFNVTNVTSYVATMLQEFEVYIIEIAAETAIGLGPFSEPVNNQTLEDVPTMAPQNVSIFEISSDSFMLSWDPPMIGEQNGILIQYHVIIVEIQIHYTDDGAEITGMQMYLNKTFNVSEGYSQLISMLHPDYNYTVRIAAATRPGIGPFSEAITNRTDMDAPTEAPINVSVTVESSSSIMLTWERPSPEEENGLLICYHVIIIETQIHYTDNGSEITGMQTYLNRTFNISEGRSQLIDMLHPDYNYTVRIAAATGPGIGPFSDAITNRTDMDAPTEVPGNVSVTVESSSSIMLTWERPSPERENGLLLLYHVIIIETQIHYTDDEAEITGMQTYLNRTFNISEERSQLIDMLHPDYNYTVRIAAATEPGIGPFSDAITVRTNMDAPTEAPRNVSVTVATSHSIMLEWERPSPEEENGLLILYHVIIIETQIHYTDNGSEITGLQTYLNTTYNISEGRTQLIGMLHPDYNYTVRIAAATEPGIGPFSDAITVRTDMDVPTEAPRNVSVTVESSSSVMLTWERPSLEQENGLLTRYHVIIIETQINYTDNGLEITGLQTYLNRTFNVSEGRTQLIGILHPDYNYTVRIAAATEPGIGPFSNAITVRTDMDVPTEAPRNVSVTVESSSSIMLTWERPSQEQENGLLIRYHVIIIETQIHYTDNGSEITGIQRYLNRTYNVSEGRLQLINMLHPDYNYTVRIAAATEPGIGPFSDAITVRTNMDAPTEVPRNVSVLVNSSSSIILSWERPSPEEENGLLLVYHVIIIETQIHYTDDEEEITGMQTYLNMTFNVSEGRSQLIDMLHPDYNYTFRIAAATGPGIGPFSEAITNRTDMDAPTEAPRNVNWIINSSSSIILSWERPSPEKENGLLLVYHVIIIETQIHYTDDGTEITGLQTYLNMTFNVSEGRLQLIDMLHPDYNYTVRIAAATGPGIGPFSAAITNRTDMDAPTEAPRNVSVTVESSSSIMLTWERPSPEEENGLLLVYHVIIIETQIHYTDDGVEITGMQTYLNMTFDVSEGRSQLIDMLHPDYNYTFRIAAATGPGIGPFSDAITNRTDMDAPTEVPRNVSVIVNSSSSIILSWERPSPEEENGLLLVYHVIIIETQIHYTDDGVEITGMQTYLNMTFDVSEGRSQLIDMLHPDYNYTFRIAAATEPGIGPFSAAITNRTDMDAPTEAPRNVSVTVESSSSITLTWERPSPEEENGLLLVYHVIIIETQIHYTDNGSEITGLQTYLNMTFDVSEGRSQLIDMLHPDYNYTFRIAAATGSGIGPFSEAITNRTDMDAPTEVPRNISVIVNSSSSIILSWERPSPEEENGLLLVYHVIIIETQIHYTDDGVEITGMQTYLNMTFDVSEGRSQLIDMLHPDYNYTFRIAAATEPGIGPFSEAITNRTDMDAPTEAPRNVSVTVESSSSITLTWERPSPEEENGLLLVYHVIIIETQIHYTDNGSEITGLQTYLNMTFDVSEGRSQLIDMLHPDYNYTFRIAAATGPGIGPFSEAITNRTDMDAPTEVPRNISVIVNSSSSIILSWERPSPEEENGLLLVYHVIIIETQIHYTDNGSEITGMQTYLNMTFDVSEGRSQLIDMLHPDYNYTFRIAAATEPGIGPFSAAITNRTDMDAPTEAPRNVSVTVESSSSIMLTWERPSPEQENGLLIRYHVIIIETQIHYTDDGSEITGLQRNLNMTFDVSEGRSQLIDMLHPDYNYTFRIAAATEPGIGPFSDAITVRTEMDAPTEVPRNVSVIVNSSRSIILSWERPSPEEENGLLLVYHVIIIETQIHYRDNGSEITGLQTYLNMTFNVSEGRSQLIDMLHPDYNYTFRIAAATGPGIGPFSAAITNRTDMDVPTEVPRNVSVIVNSSRSIILSWERPSPEEENGLLLVYHVIIIETQIHYTDDGVEITGMQTYLNMTFNVSEGRSQLIGMLHPDYNYTFRIAAATEPGIGPFSEAITNRTDMDAPTEVPRNVSVIVNSSHSIMLTWERPSPEQENGLLIRYHVIIIETQIHYTDNGSEITGLQTYLNRTFNVSEGRSQLIGMLHPDYNYTFRIAAATGPGIGPFSEAITNRTDMDAPTEVPRNVSVIVNSSHSIILSWERPSPEQENGLLISYHVIIIETQIHYTDNGAEITGMQTYLNMTFDVSEGRSQLIDMLHPDYNYTFRIAAATEPGIGPFSEAITNRTDMDAPTEAPRNVNWIVESSSSIMLTWERPSPEEENGLLLVYHVIIIETQIHYRDNGTEITGRETYLNRTFNVSEGRSQLIDVLHSDYNYTVSIAAATGPGIGPFSEAITNRTYMDIPTEVPRNVSVTVESSSSIMLTWERPSPEQENGLLIRYHVIIIETQIHYTDDGAEITGLQRYLNRTFNVSEGRSQLINTLHPDYNYTVRIAAATEPGIGPFSDAITNRTDMDAPTEVPRNVSVTVESSSSIMLTWERSSPEEENGLLIHYHVIIIETQIHYTDDGAEITGLQRYLNRTFNVSEGRSQLINMLHPDYNYTVRIAAATEPGIGPFSDAITNRTDMDAPTEAPRNVNWIVNSSSSIILTWERPSPEEENGLLIRYHVIIIETQIHYTDDGEEITGMETYLNTTFTVSEGRLQVIDMLHPDYNYTVRIAAATGPGIGPFSDAITNRTDMDVPTEAPLNLSVIVNSSRSILLSWERPSLEEENGLLVCYHVIIIETEIYYLDNGTETTPMQRHENITYNVSEGRLQLIDMLHPDYNYTVTIAAATEPGIGPFSDAVTVRTYMDVPEGHPQNFNVTAINYTTVYLSWDRPIRTLENGLIILYTITYNGSRVEKQLGDLPDKLIHYGEYIIQRDANLPREFYITNMSTLVSNSEYLFQITTSTVNGSGPVEQYDMVIIEQGTPSIPTDPPAINPSPNITLPTSYPPDPITHNTLTFVLPLPPEDDGELIEIFIIVQEPLKNDDSGKLRTIGTWYEAFTTPNDPPDYIPPAYIALEIPKDAINAGKFKRDVDGYIINRFVRQTSSGNLAIMLGNESCVPINKTICNGELKPNTNYSVAFNACTIGGCAVSPLSAPLLTDVAPPEEEKADITTLIIAIVAGGVGAVVIMIIIIVIVCYCRRRSKRQKYQISNIRDRSGGAGLGSIKGKHTKRGTKSSLLLPQSPQKKNGGFFETTEPVGPSIVPVKEQPSTYTSDDITAHDNSRRIYLRDLPAHVADMSNDSGYKFSEEYERVSEIGLEQPKEASLLAENRAKNRYTNILAYDHSRTKLSFIDDEPGSDYINANYIPGYKMKRAYIATQGPLPCTFDDFWRMVWEQNVYTIVMLTQLVERGRNKCHHYWPGMDSVLHGDVSIVMQSEKECENWTTREFVLTLEKKERVITQFQFTGWPDHGVPDNPGPVIEFVRSVRAQEDPENTNRGPIVVHCSAGVGRTGTFIALDTLLQHINDHDWIDIFSIACEMRQHRNHMVQTEAQYIFIHKALQEVVESRSTFRYSVYKKPYSEDDDNDNKQLSPVMASTKM